MPIIELESDVINDNNVSIRSKQGSDSTQRSQYTVDLHTHQAPVKCSVTQDLAARLAPVPVDENMNIFN